MVLPRLHVRAALQVPLGSCFERLSNAVGVDDFIDIRVLAQPDLSSNPVSNGVDAKKLFHLA